ncbi:hypothetical protein [Candidatus Palauibacter sp.]|uniref:hypothetical protein n=1 Tax=Candidatus Palauibacter sp. TaxID=3101350 RepID=UPI003B525F01
MTNPAILRRLQGLVGIFSGSHGRLPRSLCAYAVLLVVGVTSSAPGAAMRDSPQEVSADTLEGGRIVVSNPAPARGGGRDEWRLVEELRLGQVDGTRI